MSKELELDGRVAVVTGAGTGIGGAVSALLAGHGAHVAVVDIQEEAALAQAEKIKASGARSLGLKVDVSSSGEVAAMAGRVARELGSVDILVNCAGIYPPKSMVWELPEEVWNRVIDVNLKGTFLCCQAVCPAMMERRWGKIINFSSGHGAKGGAGHAPYSASKGGVVAFTKSLALELAPYGINVNAVAPGISDTGMPRGALSEEQIAARAKANPMGRIGRTEDLAKAVLFLASELSSYITGQTVFVNGGGVMP